ncbi:MAG: membrane protein insertase YidC [Waddliaceae bacterium]
MDKRSFFLILSLTVTLLMIKAYFESSHDKELLKWREEQVAFKKEQIETLNKEISSSRQVVNELLITDRGIETNGVILKLNGNSSTGVAFSRLEPGAKIRQLTITDEGTYSLTLLSFKEDGEPQTMAADLVNGEIQYKVKQLQSLERDINAEVTTFVIPERAIALQKTGSSYTPVGIVFNDRFTPLSGIPLLQEIVEVEKSNGQSKQEDQKYYVLQNSYQQIVFTNVGGAVIGINLPFESEENTRSVVKPIRFDREMVKNHPNSAYFPGFSYMTADASGELQEHSSGELGGFYPLLRRSVHQNPVEPKFYAFNIVSEYPDTAETIYKLDHMDDKSIVFVSEQERRTITKTYHLVEEDKAPYSMTLDIKVDGSSRGLWLTSGVPDVEMINGAPAPALKYRLTRKGTPEVIKLDIPKEPFTLSSVYPDWICNSNGFFGVIVDPLTDIAPGFRVDPIPGNILPSRLVNFSHESSSFNADKLPGYAMLLPLDNKNGTIKFRIFSGPFQTEILQSVDAAFSNPETGYNPDYIASRSFHGWFAFISAPLSKLFLFLMKVFHMLTGSWAASIVLLTIFLRMILYPLNAWSTKSMIKMQEIAPKVSALQEKYKNDPKRLQIETLNLYRKSGANPISGCLPLIIQMPFLFVMFDVLKSSFSLRGASFIPGWIDDLSAPDVLFSWDTPIFFIGNQFHLLPILLGAVMFIQQRVMSPSAPKDPSEMTDQQRQQRAMGSVMTIGMSLMFYHFPSGLNIYWLSSMLLGIGQQKLTKHFMKKNSKEKEDEIIELKPRTKKKR